MTPPLRYFFLPLCLLLSSVLAAQGLQVAGKKTSLQINGSVSLGGFFYNSTREFSPISPYGYSFNANLNLNFKDIDIPLAVAVNEQGSAFRHPFNRFGISPNYKALTLHLGHRNLHWSPFVLGGATVFGAGVEFNPGKLRMGALIGRLEPTFRFRLSGDVVPEYKRKLFATKIGWGKNDNFFDIIALKGKDDATSSAETPDSVLKFIPAQENLTVGLHWQRRLFKDKLTWTGDIAGSVFTEDQRFAPIEVDTFRALNWFAENLLAFNASTRANYAGETSLKWQAGRFSIDARYRRVMPEYETFGTNYLLTDLEAYTLNPRYSFAQNSINIGVSAGWQNNNLDKRLLQTTSRFIGSMDLSINTSEIWGLYAQYSNYALEQQVILDTLQQDSFAIDQISHNFTVSPRITINKDQLVHNFFINANHQRFNDNNPLTAATSENTLSSLGLNYLLMFKNQGINIRSSINYLSFNAATFSNQQLGCLVGVTKSFANRKFTLGGFGQFARTMSDDFIANNLSYRFTTAFKISPKSTLSLQYNGLKNQRAASGFSESRGDLSWRWRW